VVLLFVLLVVMLLVLLLVVLVDAAGAPIIIARGQKSFRATWPRRVVSEARPLQPHRPTSACLRPTSAAAAASADERLHRPGARNILLHGEPAV
jgi:hypothetical protein